MLAELSRKLGMLKEFLISEAVDDDAMVLSELDGFLSGLAVGPEAVMPSEWLPLVWGKKPPRFEDERQAQAVFSAIMEHYNSIVFSLDRGIYEPIFDALDDEPLWQMWIYGFWTAVNLRLQAWLDFPANEDADAEVRVAIFSLGRLYQLANKPAGGLKPLEIDDALVEFAPDVLADAVETLHHARQDADAASSVFGPLPVRRKKVGRNQPCPCGSGKKFKKCCA